MSSLGFSETNTIGYYSPSATSSGHWLFEERLPFLYFPSAFTFLRKLPVFRKKDSNNMP
jgi:hypothetical protein